MFLVWMFNVHVLLFFCVHIELNYLHFIYLWNYWCKIGGRKQQTFSKHVARSSLFRTKNATDEKCKRQEKSLASLHVPFCLNYLIVKRTVPKKDYCTKMVIGNPVVWVLFLYISTKIHLDALYWNTPRWHPKDCPQHAHLLCKFAYVLFCVKMIRPRTICFEIRSRIPVWACFWMHYSETHLEGIAIECTQHAHLPW